MSMLLACGPDGLKVRQDGWHALPCPLQRADMLASDGAHLAVLDNSAHALWAEGRIFTVDSGVEALLLWQGGVLTLSGDTDCLTLHSLQTGHALVTAPAGVYPQDMCLLPGGRSLAVCGGADGMVRIFRLPELMEEAAIRLTGSAARITCMGSTLYALCTLEDDGLQCQLCRIQGNRWQALARWPGLPGAILAQDDTLWIACSERLCAIRRGLYHSMPGDFGLIRHLSARGADLLATDPVMDSLWLLSPVPVLLYEGAVEHGIM